MRILLAEDERSLSRALVTLFNHEHYDVDPVFDGRAALDHIQSGNYDAAILDIMMPEMDGLTVLKHVREANNQVPILLLTARGEVEDRVLGLDSGANDYLPKPFDFKELVAKVRAMTRSHAPGGSSVLTVGEVQFNRENFQLSTPIGSVRLFGKEGQLMEFFMTNPGRLHTEERLMEIFRPEEGENDPELVLLYLSYLNRKLTALNAPLDIKKEEGSFLLGPLGEEERDD